MMQAAAFRDVQRNGWFVRQHLRLDPWGWKRDQRGNEPLVASLLLVVRPGAHMSP